MARKRHRRKKYGFSFSWRRAFGVSSLKQKWAKFTGIPTSKGGRQRKFSRWFGIK